MNNTDKIFREKLSRHSVSAPAQAWGKIQAKLPENSAKGKQRLLALWPAYAAACAVFLLALSVSLSTGRQENPERSLVFSFDTEMPAGPGNQAQALENEATSLANNPTENKSADRQLPPPQQQPVAGTSRPKALANKKQAAETVATVATSAAKPTGTLAANALPTALPARTVMPVEPALALPNTLATRRYDIKAVIELNIVPAEDEIWARNYSIPTDKGRKKPIDIVLQQLVKLGQGDR